MLPEAIEHHPFPCLLELSIVATVVPMVFGLSYGEATVLLVACVALLGPKDLPIITRAAGRLTGKAVGYIQTMRGQVDTIMQQTQVHEVQKELRETMAQLDAIRYEIRTGVSIMQPRPFVRETLDSYPSHIQQATTVEQKFESTVDQSVQKNPNSPIEGGHQSSVELQRQATSYSCFAGHLNMREMKSQSASGISFAAKEYPQGESSSQKSKQIFVIPISAVSMGLFPSRTGTLEGGSDLVVESLAERKVAQQALEFLEQPDTST